MAIWIDISLISLVVALAALWPLLRAKSARFDDISDGAGDAIAVEKRLYQQRLSELESDISRGVLEQGAAQEARAELGRALIASAEKSNDTTSKDKVFIQPLLIVWLVLAIGAAYGVYAKIGAPALHGQPILSLAQATADREEIATAIERVEAQMAKTPDDVRGWQVLAPIYRRMGENNKAINAHRRILELNGPSVETQTELAELLLLVEGEANRQEAKQLLTAAQKMLPGEVKPRFLLAVIAMQENRFDLATTLWSELLAGVAADDPAETWMEIAREGLLQAQANGADGVADTDDPSAPNPSREDIEAVGALSPADRQELIKNMVETLGQRLQTEGGTVAEWQRYIRSLAVLGEGLQAVDARDRALENLSDPAERAAIEALADELGLAQLGSGVTGDELTLEGAQ